MLLNGNLESGRLIMQQTSNPQNVNNLTFSNRKVWIVKAKDHKGYLLEYSKDK